MTDAFAPAIAALQSELSDLERKSKELKGTINVLCKHAGIAEMYPNLSSERNGTAITSIRADTFYGKPINTAAREFLEMRKAANLGPATPREIYDALIAGGFQFDTKSDQVALVSLRGNLRKNSKTFHKLPNGQYGLLSWYPNAKPAKNGDDSDNETKSAASSKPAAEDVSDEEPANHHEGGSSDDDADEDGDPLG
ncbi:hypothetical protein [Novosphingobium sp.]|uniref:hypothetical protein n=1 Tax=Novosphingobium sp. TaxID=1874826 RepID=UPI002615A8DE|nr:hypothetical protein [Novosphingobium sp.]